MPDPGAAVFLSVVFGVVAGFSLGLTGGGGSIFAVPLLVYGLGIAPRAAVGASLAAVGGTTLPWRTTALFVAGGIVGMWLGTRLGRPLSGPRLQRLFAAAILLVAA